MTINSLQFLFFFSVVFVLYWSIQKNYKLQNILLLGASYYFYGVANWKMCALLLVATTIFYFLGIAIEKNVEKNEKKASLLTTTGVLLGVGVLLYFKYLNFFIESFASLFNAIGLHCNAHTFNIILPIGISFFTFKLISYVLEVSRQRMDATRDFISFATYVAFFPTILSGPIDRPNKFIPQLQKNKAPQGDLLIEGFVQIMWGLVMKMCVADRITLYTSGVFDDLSGNNGVTILFACLLYPIEMYADFAGYSDMAIGVGKLLGIKVADNFKFPFFGRNIAEYWRNWHISLTSWLTDYVFMPLNVKFRNMGEWGSELAILITFVLIGLWHGANWTFALFGLYHGLLYIPLMLSGAFFKKKKLKLNNWNLPGIADTGRMLWTFVLVALGLVVFRAESVGEAVEVIFSIGNPWSMPVLSGLPYIMLGILIILIHDLHHAFGAFKVLNKIPLWLKTMSYIIIILALGVTTSNQFIYFQF